MIRSRQAPVQVQFTPPWLSGVIFALTLTVCPRRMAGGGGWSIVTTIDCVPPPPPPPPVTTCCCEEPPPQPVNKIPRKARSAKFIHVLNIVIRNSNLSARPMAPQIYRFCLCVRVLMTLRHLRRCALWSGTGEASMHGGSSLAHHARHCIKSSSGAASSRA